MVNAENITIYGMFGALALVIGGLFLKDKKLQNKYDNMKNATTNGASKVASEIVKSVSPSQRSNTFASSSSSNGGSKRKTKKSK